MGRNYWGRRGIINSINIKKLIQDKQLYCAYQPLIHSRNHTIFSYEALLRTTTGIDPSEIFQKAREDSLLYEMDTFCIENALREYPNEHIGKYPLFINIFPSTIIHTHFKDFIRRLTLNNLNIASQIVFEINETSYEEDIWEDKLFIKRISMLKSLGFNVALDDLRITKTAFNKIKMVSPAFIKLDHTRAKGLSISIEKQELILFFLEFTREKIRLVLEGIESKEELLTAKQLGVPLLQGNYISKPKRLKINEA